MIPSLVVTSWSDKGAKLYGDKWLAGYNEHWHFPVRILTDSDILKADPEVREFRRLESDKKTVNRSMQWGAMRWSWKVFALTMRPLPREGWMIWIDGDVEFIKQPTKEFFNAVCPHDADVSFLGRPWAFGTETGFVAYRMDNPHVRLLLENMRYVYLTGSFRDAVDHKGKPNWGDSPVFDMERKKIREMTRLGILESDPVVFDRCRSTALIRENDLSSHCKPGDMHVWPQTVLGEFMSHQKGPSRKAEAYGGEG